MTDPVTDEMVAAYQAAADATPCPACGKVPQCRCYVPGGREPYRIRRGLAAALGVTSTHRSGPGTRMRTVDPAGGTTSAEGARGAVVQPVSPQDNLFASIDWGRIRHLLLHALTHGGNLPPGALREVGRD